jgi:LysM repeat protein
MKKLNLKGILSCLPFVLALAIPSESPCATEDTAQLIFQKPAIAKTGTSAYSVKKGDTLSGIVARSLGSFPAAERKQIYKIIKTLNPKLTNYNKIYVGQQLRLPSKYVVSDDKNIRISALQISSGGVPVESALVGKGTLPALERSYLPTGYRIAVIREVIQKMNGTITTAGNYYIPLPQAGRVAIDCSRIPVVELPDGSSVLIDFTERAPVSFKSMIETNWPSYTFVSANHQEEPEKILQKVINASRSYTMTKSQKPMSFGDIPHVEISADWVIAEKATGGKSPYRQGISLIKNRHQALPENVKDYAGRNGVVITELIDGTGVVSSPALKSDVPEVAVLGGVTNIDYCAALLRYLGYQPAENVDIDVFNRNRDGFNLAVKAELLVKKDNSRITFHSKELPPQFIQTLKDKGIDMVTLGEKDSRQVVIEKTLSALKIPFSKGIFLYPLAADPAGNPRSTVSFPAIKMSRDASSLHFIDFAMDQSLYQTLYNRGSLRLVRF